MSFACPSVLRRPVLRALLVCAGVALAGGCEREKREFEPARVPSNSIAQAEGVAELQPGHEGRGMREVAAAGGYDASSAYAVSQGKTLYRWFNCAGCHAQGGGAIGPALMDDRWIYGKKPDDIFRTIMEGRPNGMPSFRGRIPEAQAWQLVAYVRSMSGLLPAGVEPGRDEGLLGAPPESVRKPVRPDEEPPKK